MPIEIRRTPLGGNVRDFLNVVDYIYRADPNFVRPLDMELKERLSHKNPFWQHAEGVILTAHRNGFCVGRCTAQIDREHLAKYCDDVGSFGFFDTIEDPEVASALVNAASQWLRERGMRRIRGPLSLSLNDEAGCLVEGFDTPPMLMMPHHLPYQGGLLEQSGLKKLKDLYAWRYIVGKIPERARRAHDEIDAMPEVKARNASMKNLDTDLRTLIDVFNDGWSDNWGVVPFTEAELKKQARDLKLIIDPRLSLIVTINDEPAAIAVALPNLNEAIRDFGGKLLPFNAPKLLYRLKVQRPKTARLILLGIRKKFRNQKRYAALSTYMYAKMDQAGQRIGVDWGELSWTLEDNTAVNVAIKFMGGKIYKRYRLYEGEL
ncbi:MAG TPA: hypothetical protein VKP30_03790 [Polyangiaceae bacterium]|nr:hypothetical protein [Polyangiaceae bacterium]